MEVHERKVFILPAPVVIFVYNRPDHTKKTIEALAENYLAKETDVFIFSDAAKNEKATANVQMTRKYIETVPDKNLFKSVEIIKAPRNKGLANSIISGVSEIVDKYGRVIVLEDDLITSTVFLKFMNSALDYYQNEEKIFTISGYSNIDIPKSYNDSVYFSHISTSWGWATWKKEWDSVIWDHEHYKNIMENKKLLREYKNKIGNERIKMLKLQLEGKIDSWAIRRLFSQLEQKKFTVFPSKTLVINIGLDGSGTHSGLNKNFDKELMLSHNFGFEEVKFEENKEINKCIYKKNNKFITRKIFNRLKKIMRI